MDAQRIYPGQRDWFYSMSYKSNAQRIQEREKLMLEDKQQMPEDELRQLSRLEDLPAKEDEDRLLANPFSMRLGEMLMVKIRHRRDAQNQGKPITLHLPLPKSTPSGVNNTVAGIVARVCEHIIQNPADPRSSDAVLGGGRLGKEAVVNAAMRAAYRAHGLANAPPLTLIAPTFEKQRRRFVLTVRRLDPQALHQKSVTSIFVIAKNMRLDLPVPRCPGGDIKWVVGISSDAKRVRNVDDRIPDSADEIGDRDQLVRALDLAKYITFLFEGSVGSHSDLRAAMNALVSAYSLHKPRQERVGMKLQGSRRLEILVTSGNSVLCVSAAMSRWKNVLPRLSIHSSRPMRQFSAAERIMRPREPGAHLVDAWKEAAAEADAENNRIERGTDPPGLYPSEPLGPADMCLCRGCGRQVPFVASRKHRQLGWLVCLQCDRLSEEEMERAYAEQLPPNLYGRLKALINFQDYAPRGLLKPDTKQERKSVVEQHKKHLASFKKITTKSHSAISWIDAYCNMFPNGVPDNDKRFWTSGLVPRRSSPFVASVDAVYRIDDDDAAAPGAALPPRTPTSWHHAIGNLVVTSSSLNSLKFDSPPIILKILKQYRQGQSAEELKHAFQGLLNLYLIEAAGRAGALQSQSWPEGVDKARLKRAWYGARLTRLPTEGEVKSAVRWAIPKGTWEEHDASWRPSAGLQRRYSEIPSSWGFKAGQPDFRGGDAEHDYRLWCTRDAEGDWVPYPFGPLSKPYVEWTWWRLHVWMKSKYRGTVQHCNVSWANDTSLDTYQLSLMQAHFCHLSRDRESLRRARRADPSIPDRDPVPRDDFGLSPWPWSGGRTSASVSHRRDHKLAMDGGYMGTVDVESEDLTYDDAKRNLSLDTRAANYAVCDFAIETWPDIAKQLDHLVDDGKYWEPGISAWADESWTDEKSLDPADCVGLARRDMAALEELDKHDEEQQERGISQLAAGLVNAAVGDGLSGEAESSDDDSTSEDDRGSDEE